MPSTLEVITAYTKAYSVAPWPVGQPPKAARVVVNTIDTTGAVQLQVGVANQNDGANPPLLNTAAFPTVSSPTIAYSPAGGAGSGIPLDGPPADARNIALANATGQLMTTLVATLTKAGGTWP
jgi:hypothetical protein